MKKQDFTTSIAVDAAAQEVFKCINSVSKWWTEDLEGHSEKLNDIFTVRFGETFITVKIIEHIPPTKIAWYVIDCNKPWLKDRKEWNDTTINWDISEKDGKTQIEFTHLGLVPQIECFEVCSNAWSQYIHQSFLGLVTTGNGYPTKKTLDKVG